MTRPSRNTDKLLIQAAKELIPKTGISGLTIRDVSKKAGVNLGMFNYHFKTKDAFIDKLLVETYEDFFTNFKIESATGGTPKERLKNAVMTIAFFVRDNRQIFIMVAKEIALGNKVIIDFIKKHMTRHIEILVKLTHECQKEGYIINLPLLQVLPFIMGSVMATNLLVTAIERFSPVSSSGIMRELFAMAADKTLLADKAIVQRVDMALNALTPRKEPI